MEALRRAWVCRSFGFAHVGLATGSDHRGIRKPKRIHVDLTDRTPHSRGRARRMRGQQPDDAPRMSRCRKQPWLPVMFVGTVPPGHALGAVRAETKVNSDAGSHFRRLHSAPSHR